MSWNPIFSFLVTKNVRHAPRERVSWNNRNWGNPYRGRRSRSTWACELKFNVCRNYMIISMSRSTWACELKWNLVSSAFHKKSSRSTWACELKLSNDILKTRTVSHAPRERVSWNQKTTWKWCFCQESRSTWACELKSEFVPMQGDICIVTLHVSVWVEIITAK